jgi:hypothetical protein
MNLMICAALLPNVFLNDFLVTVLAYRVRIISAGPELATPEHFPHFRVESENLFCGNALYDLDNHVRGESRNALNEKVYVIFICTNLYESDLKPVFYAHAQLFQRILHLLAEYLSPIFSAAYNVIKKQGLVMSLQDMFTHSYILPRSRASRNLLIERKARLQTRTGSLIVPRRFYGDFVKKGVGLERTTLLWYEIATP